MPAKKTPAQAASEEATTEKSAEVEVELSGETYRFRRARFRSVAFRLALRDAMTADGFDIGLVAVALRELFGRAEWDRIVAASSDEDGMPPELLSEIMNAASDAAGQGKF